MTSVETLPGGAQLLQSDAHLKIGTDAVLLAEHAGSGNKICELGCGCGAVLLRLCELRPAAALVGLELLPDAAELCRESIARSGFAGRASVVTGDLRDRAVLASLGTGRFDLVVANPPYLRTGSGKSPDAPVDPEREDVAAPPEAVAAAASYLLKNGGGMTLVLRQDRLADYICALRAAGVEPKKLTLVRTVSGERTKLTPLILLRGVMGGKPGMTVDEIEC